MNHSAPACIKQAGPFYDIAQSPWTDDGRIYASLLLVMSDADQNRVQATPAAPPVGVVFRLIP